MLKDEFIILRVESELKNRLKEIAESNGQSLSEYIRVILESVS